LTLYLPPSVVYREPLLPTFLFTIKEQAGH
jgi:hypothetical protein